jgi:hypothetical protein
MLHLLLFNKYPGIRSVSILGEAYAGNTWVQIQVAHMHWGYGLIRVHLLLA